MKHILSTIGTLTLLIVIYLSLPTTIQAQTCELPTSCQFNRTTTHVVSAFPCWDGDEPLFTTPESAQNLTHNEITIDDNGTLGGENCGGAPSCQNDLVLQSPDPSYPVKGLWWRMHDHEEGLDYDLYACRTALTNGDCPSWELLVENLGVDTSGEGKEQCSEETDFNHPPGDQGCPDPLPDPKTCSTSSNRSDWPCAMSFDEHTWTSNTCAPQNITAFRISFDGDDAHAHVADAIWILDGVSCTIEGTKLPDQGPFSINTITLKDAQGTVLETTTEQPYAFTNLPPGRSYTIEASGTNVSGSTTCAPGQDCTINTHNSYEEGTTRTIANCPGGQSVEVNWFYGEDTPTPTVTGTPAMCTQDASITLSAPPAVDAGDITLRVKFQGAFANNIVEAGATQPLKVSIIKQLAEQATGLGLQTISSKTFENVTVTNTGEVDENGIAIYEGTFTPTAIVPGSNYSVLVKGPYHLQRKFCENNATEQAEEGLPYVCRTVGTIALTEGTNRLDFSGVLLQGGDLPGSQGQDGVVNAYDVSLLLSILDQKGNSNDAQDLSVADMDFNGVVNAKDRSNIIETLEEKYGDEEPF